MELTIGALCPECGEELTFSLLQINLEYRRGVKIYCAECEDNPSCLYFRVGTDLDTLIGNTTVESDMQDLLGAVEQMTGGLDVNSLKRRAEILRSYYPDED